VLPSVYYRAVCSSYNSRGNEKQYRIPYFLLFVWYANIDILACFYTLQVFGVNSLQSNVSMLSCVMLVAEYDLMATITGMKYLYINTIYMVRAPEIQ
jgi:hypothetical protein